MLIGGRIRQELQSCHAQYLGSLEATQHHAYEEVVDEVDDCGGNDYADDDDDVNDDRRLRQRRRPR